ncbi:MAG: lipid A deacylase LpxR family protein [Chitinophagaceae bacterium]|jgi:hypothetical protein|nr:lipid A deacylase LpxR family protein [Chitinophagaceae bacterium]
MKKFCPLPFVFLLFVYHGSAQEKKSSIYSKEFSVITENDAYLLTGDDGYYTNGLFLNFSWTGNKISANKKIHSLEIAQLMYTGQYGFFTDLSDIDRPVTALLYAEYKQTSFNKNESVLQWSAMGGEMGAQALGRQTQDMVHNMIDTYTPTEWQFQLHSSVGANAEVNWAPNVFHNTGEKHFAFTPQVNARAGMFFTDASTGFVIQWGAFEKNSRSALWNARIGRSQETAGKKKELFFYFSPMVGYRIYNATVQGGLFTHKQDDAQGLSRSLVPFFYRQKIGVLYAKNRIDAGFSIVFDSREAEEQRTNHWYGSIKIGYLFGK